MEEVKKTHKIFQVILFIVLGIFFTAVGLYMYHHWVELPEEFRTKDKPFYLVNVVIALAAIATAIFTWWKNTISKEQVEVAQRQTQEQIKQTENAQRQTDNLIEQTKNAQKQIELSQSQLLLQEDIRLDSQYTSAAELLNQENDPIRRKAGVHILKNLAINSPKHTQQCVDMLCSLNEVWMPFIINQNPDFFINKEFDWVNKKVSNEDLIEKFKIKGIKEKYDKIDDLIEEISVSQTVIKHIQLIIEHFNNSEDINEIDLSFKYLCSLKFSAGKTNGNNFNFRDCILVGSHFEYFSCENLDFTNCNLRGSLFDNCIMQSAVFSNCNLEFSEFKSCQLPNCEFGNSKIKFSHFLRCKLMYADFLNAVWIGSYITECEFEGTYLASVDLENSRISFSTFYGVFAPRISLAVCNVEKCKFLGVDLFAANFQGAIVKDTSFSSSMFIASNFSGGSFIGVNFSSALFLECKLEGALILNKSIPFVLGEFVTFKKKNISIFGTSIDNFKTYISIEIKNYPEKYQESYNLMMMNGYDIFHGHFEDDFKQNFEISLQPNKEVLNLRNSVSLISKSIAERLLLLSGKNVHSGHKLLIKEVTKNLEEFISLNKPEWYLDFKNDGIIKE